VLSYICFGTNDLKKATAFYDAILAPLGMRRLVTNDPEFDRIAANCIDPRARAGGKLCG
jgi:catechol 2,3-dioxygenase-like lactoylglutathione lyase family enzyme